MTISYLQKACVSALFLVIALVSTHAVASTQPQTFSGEIEETGVFSPDDVIAFTKLGDFIDPNSLGVRVLCVVSHPIRHTHSKDVKSVFKSHAPLDLQKAYRQFYIGKYKGRVPSYKASSVPTIIVAPNAHHYKYGGLIKIYPDTVILISAGNGGEANPESAIRSYQKVSGKNIFHVGGTHYSGYLHKESGKPGAYRNAYIADPYGAKTLKREVVYGTSFSVQTIGVKLAVLYKALNVNHTWSMVDAMQLLMTTRNENYSADLTKLLVKDDNGEIYVGSDGKTQLLPEEDLRKKLSISPLHRYKN